MRARRRRRPNPLPDRHLEPHRDKADLLKVEYQPQASERHIRDFSGQVVDYVGCVVNPKTMRPYFVLKRRSANGFQLYVPSTRTDDAEVVGICYLEDSDNEYAAPAEHLGFPRIHTPWGVVEHGTGLGTALYTAGALGGGYVAVGFDEGFAPDRLPGIGGHGCSSGTGASSDAEEWWQNAASRGLAEEHEGEGSSYEEQDSISEYAALTSSVALDLDKILNASDASHYIGEAVEEQIRDEAYDALLDQHAFDGLDDFELRDYDLERIDRVLRFKAVVNVWLVDEDDDPEQVEVEVDLNVDSLDPDDWNTLVEDHFVENSTSIPGFENAEPAAVGLHNIDKVLNVGGSGYIDVELTATAWGSGPTTVTRDGDDSTMYAYPLKNAVRKKLVLDMAPALLFRYNMDDKRLLDVVLNLDLGEVEDPNAVAFFFALATHLGADHKQLRRFMNSVLAFRSDLPASLADAAFDDTLEADEDREDGPRERAAWFAILEEGGFRVNPSPTPVDYAKVGRRIYGDLTDLEGE